jgi:hypothetical protein
MKIMIIVIIEEKKREKEDLLEVRNGGRLE